MLALHANFEQIHKDSTSKIQKMGNLMGQRLRSLFLVHLLESSCFTMLYRFLLHTDNIQLCTCALFFGFPSHLGHSET